MQFTNINIDAIEEALPAAFLNIRNQLIEDALKAVNIWLTPNPNVVEVISVIFYKTYSFRENFPLNINEQRQLIEKMFDDNMSSVYVSKTKQLTIKNWFGTKVENLTSEDQRYLFPTLSSDLKREIDHIKEFLLALRNPRVTLTLEEYKVFVRLLKYFNINLSDYYI